MSIYSISDITPAGAFCNAMAAARENDRRVARREAAASAENAKVSRTAHASLATIRAAIGDALRHMGRVYRTETA